MAGLLNNPIYVRLTQHTRLPSVRVMLWAGFALGLVVLAVTLYDTLHLMAEPISRMTGWLFAMALIITLANPLVAAVVAAILAGRDAASDQFHMQMIMLFTARGTVCGYAAASLAKMRLLLALAMGLMPALIMGFVQADMADVFAEGRILASCTNCLWRISAIPDMLRLVMGPRAVLGHTATALWTVGLVLPAVALGVWCGLRLRALGTAAVAAVVSVLAGAGVIAALYVITPMSPTILLYVCGWLLMAIIPYGIGCLALRGAERETQRRT